MTILRSGLLPKTTSSRYAKNYRFFEGKINSFVEAYPSYFAFLPARILNNCILLPIEADSQDTALRIFSTLNDRGLPLADADIFKAQFYKYYEQKDKKDDFIDDWKLLASKTDRIFDPIRGTPMDELFTKYMYYIRASEHNRSTTTEALRKFYEHERYRRLLRPNTVTDLKDLIEFWEDVFDENTERFSEDVLQKLFVLKYAPNSMWEYVKSVYYFSFRDEDGELDNKTFASFLSKITAFIFAYSLTNPGVNALRTPIYSEMIKIYNQQLCDFSEFLFDADRVRNALENYKFTNYRMVTRSMLTWYAFTFDGQKRPSIQNTRFDIEHIYAKERHNKENRLQNTERLEDLGNKILLESSINVRASDYRFQDKKRYYSGYTDASHRTHPASIIVEFRDLILQDDFYETDIERRTRQINNKFIHYLESEGLLKK